MTELTNYLQGQESRLAFLERKVEILEKAAAQRSSIVYRDELMDILGISLQTLYVKKSRGELPQTIGGRLMWKRSDIENWLHSTQKNGRITNKARL